MYHGNFLSWEFDRAERDMEEDRGCPCVPMAISPKIRILAVKTDSSQPLIFFLSVRLN